MPQFEFCLPTVGKAVPDRPDWLHEIKYDGYRLRLERDGDRVRLITRGGHNWADRYPWIVEAAQKNRIKRFIIDGEAVVLGVDGVADFNACTRASASTTMKCSCMPLTSWRSMATICGACPCPRARRTSPGCCRSSRGWRVPVAIHTRKSG